MRIIGIDPSLNNTAVALFQDEHPEQLQIVTRHIKELEPGDYTRVIRELADPEGLQEFVPCNALEHLVTAGFVEDFSNIGGGDTNKVTIKSVSHAGGMAEEAVVALGIPMMPITVREWRNAVLGKAAKHPQRSGRMVSYWTKGDKKCNVPDNLTPALLVMFRYLLDLEAKADYSKLLFGKFKDHAPITTFDEAIAFIREHSPTPRRIQIVFGISLDELEAAAIAVAGYKLIKEGKIEGLK